MLLVRPHRAVIDDHQEQRHIEEVGDLVDERARFVAILVSQPARSKGQPGALQRSSKLYAGNRALVGARHGYEAALLLERLAEVQLVRTSLRMSRTGLRPTIRGMPGNWKFPSRDHALKFALSRLRTSQSATGD